MPQQFTEETMIVQLNVAQLRIILAENTATRLTIPDRMETDKLLTPAEAAAILGQTVRWIYRHAAKLPFTRRISKKNLRFSEAGLRRWIAAKKPPLNR
jgi:predicted DNA-binding transcriptional regulator AlpA